MRERTALDEFISDFRARRGLPDPSLPKAETFGAGWDESKHPRDEHNQKWVKADEAPAADETGQEILFPMEKLPDAAARAYAGVDPEIREFEEKLWHQFDEGRVRDTETSCWIDSHGNYYERDGDENSVAFSVDECASMKDAVFTHYHPGGGPFSRDDIMTGTKMDVAEMRAFGQDVNGARWIYRLQRGPDGWPEKEMDRWEHGEDTKFTTWANRQEDRIRRQIGPLVVAGKLRSDEAWVEHFHRLWTAMAKKYHLTYTRTRVNP